MWSSKAFKKIMFEYNERKNLNQIKKYTSDCKKEEVVYESPKWKMKFKKFNRHTFNTGWIFNRDRTCQRMKRKW
jgi:hypothetical protein